MRSCLSAVLFAACSVLSVTGLADNKSPISVGLAPLPGVTKPAGLQFTKDHQTLYFNANVGSFKILSINEQLAEGTLDFTFRGTVLVSGLEPGGLVKMGGTVHREVNDEKYNKQVFFGEGRMTIIGKFRAVQFFGRDLRARFDGFGYCRMYGEFDRNLETGLAWYADTAEDKQPWSTGGSQYPVPRAGAVLPKVKIEGGKG